LEQGEAVDHRAEHLLRDTRIKAFALRELRDPIEHGVLAMSIDHREAVAALVLGHALYDSGTLGQERDKLAVQAVDLRAETTELGVRARIDLGMMPHGARVASPRRAMGRAMEGAALVRDRQTAASPAASSSDTIA